MKKDAFLLIVGLIIISNVVFAQINFWQDTNGPAISGTPFGGDVLTLVAHNNDLFSSVRDVGSFHSTNYGSSWYPLKIDSTNPKTNCYIVSDSGLVYAGTSNGLFVSIKNRDSWDKIFTGSVYRATITRKGTIIIAADPFFESSIIHRSTDNGASWTKADSGITYHGVLSLVVAPDSTIYAGTKGYGIFKSTDDGMSWNECNSGIPAASAGAGNYWYVLSLLLTPSGRIIAEYNGAIYSLSDSHSQWIKMKIESGYSSISCLASTPSGLLFAGNHSSAYGIMRSTDDGETWNKCNSGLKEWWIESLTSDAIGNVFAGTSNGVFKSTDYGASWKNSSEGLTGADVRSLSVNSNGFLFAATANGGVYLSTDRGQNWQSKNNGIMTKNIRSVIVTQTNDVFIGTLGGAGVYRSTNNGDNWISKNSGLVDSNVTSFQVDSNGYFFVSTFSGIFRSTNAGETWSESDSGLSSVSVRSIVAFQNGSLCAATSGGVYVSSNQGISWEARNNGLNNLDVSSIVAAKMTTLFAGTNGGIFSSTDAGEHWFACNEGFQSTSITSLSINSTGYLFAGSKIGLFRSRVDTLQWVSVNSGLTTTNVQSIIFDQAGYAFIGTSSGVFTSSQTTTLKVNNETNHSPMFFLRQNFPNPFNPTTMIEFSIPFPNYVTLKIYSIIGQEVSTIVSEELPKGNFRRKWDATGLSNGVYLYRLQAGSFTETKKLMFLK